MYGVSAVGQEGADVVASTARPVAWARTPADVHHARRWCAAHIRMQARSNAMVSPGGRGPRGSRAGRGVSRPGDQSEEVLSEPEVEAATGAFSVVVPDWSEEPFEESDESDEEPVVLVDESADGRCAFDDDPWSFL